MRFTRSLGGALLTAAVALAAACGDTTAPGGDTGPPFDGVAALRTVEPLTSVIDQEIFASFDGALSHFEVFIGRGTDPIPTDALGRTFVYDPVTATYVVDPAGSPGAPAAGVRFVLYGWDGPLGRPAMPLERVGHLDIVATGGGTTSESVAHLMVVSEGPESVIADFVRSHGTIADGTSFLLQGWALGGTTKVNVAVDGTYTGAPGQKHLVYNSTLWAPSLGIHAFEQLVYDQATASETGRSELRYDGHTLTDESVATGSEVRFDGALYARVLFAQPGGEETRFLRPDGTPLPPAEIHALEDLLLRVGVSHFFWQNLAFP
jgi:hypothetical protein